MTAVQVGWPVGCKPSKLRQTDLVYGLWSVGLQVSTGHGYDLYNTG